MTGAFSSCYQTMWKVKHGNQEATWSSWNPKRKGWINGIFDGIYLTVTRILTIGP